MDTEKLQEIKDDLVDGWFRDNPNIEVEEAVQWLVAEIERLAKKAGEL